MNSARRAYLEYLSTDALAQCEAELAERTQRGIDRVPNKQRALYRLILSDVRELLAERQLLLDVFDGQERAIAHRD